MRINIEFVFVEKFIEDHSSSGQSVKAVVLVIFISEFVDTHDFSAKGLIFLFEVPAPPSGPFSSDFKD